jgi:PAS domain S-box-containing protein
MVDEKPEEPLRCSEAELRLLLNTARNFVVYQLAVDADHPYGARVVMVSPSIRTIVGIEAPDRFETWFANIHPDDEARILRANRRALERGEPYDQRVRVYHQAKGEWVWLHTVSTPVYDAESTLTHYNGLIVDITEQKRAEEDLQRAYLNLEQRIEERTHEIERRRQVAEGLRDLLAVLNSNRPLPDVMSYLVQQSSNLLDSDACLTYRLEQDGRRLVMDSEHNLPPDYRALRSGPVYPTPIVQAMLSRQPAGIGDLAAYASSVIAASEGTLTRFHQHWLETAVRHYRSVLGVPLIVKGELYGGMVFYYREARSFSDEDYRLAGTLGDHAALAIENARLHQQIEDTAAAAERSRLARELHDAVSQTLFSASLIAEVLPRLWERDRDEGSRRLEELRQLTRGALAEMRTLLLELRPAALVQAELGGLLRQLAEAITGRARIAVQVTVTGNCDLPVDVKIALYRIAQEALNNVAKHAAATSATVSLDCHRRGVSLRIADDGRGFDLAKVPSDHLGLGIMRERADAIGAELQMESRCGQGTTITVVLSAPGEP